MMRRCYSIQQIIIQGKIEKANIISFISDTGFNCREAKKKARLWAGSNPDKIGWICIGDDPKNNYGFCNKNMFFVESGKVDTDRRMLDFIHEVYGCDPNEILDDNEYWKVIRNAENMLINQIK